MKEFIASFGNAAGGVVVYGLLTWAVVHFFGTNIVSGFDAAMQALDQAC